MFLLLFVILHIIAMREMENKGRELLTKYASTNEAIPTGTIM